MNNRKDSEIAWISIQDKINKEWKTINGKKEEEKIINFKEAARKLQKKKTVIR
jgi:hypothetical protein|tara:strand:+ start:1868 stop:2026 length:159 start_codon:yes stop_codon:yes gene_type:complete